MNGRISLEAQRRGAIAASEWFYNSMTKAGEDGPRILNAVDRLGQLFRLHRFADKPIESSLIGFSVKESDLSEEARHVLSGARSRSFLVDIFGGQRERNTSDRTTKFQLNRMLAPRWDLPTSRRGITPFSPVEADAIFCADNVAAFEALKRDWETSSMRHSAFVHPTGRWIRWSIEVTMTHRAVSCETCVKNYSISYKRSYPARRCLGQRPWLGLLSRCLQCKRADYLDICEHPRDAQTVDYPSRIRIRYRCSPRRATVYLGKRQ